VVYCFENDIALEPLLEEEKQAFEKYVSVKDAEIWIV